MKPQPLVLSTDIPALWNLFRDKITVSYTEQERNLLDASFALASKAHQNQVRKSGEPYILHPMKVCEILLDINMDCIGICSALLHDVVEDSDTTIDDIAKLTNPAIASIVDGCTKLKSNATNLQDPIAHYYRNIITKSGEDIRTLIVKLADRLHNMRTLHYLNPDKVKRISLETEEIYAPLARRLGLYNIYTEMLDLCFKANHPMRYDAIDKDRQAIINEREQATNDWKQDLEDSFQDSDKSWSFIDMPRSNYAIYRRLKLTKHRGATLKPLIGGGQFALMTKTANECYEALGYIHNYRKFQHNNANVTDFISMPKINGYQSIHTQVYDTDGNRIMFAIRSKMMHQRASLGVMSYSINDLDSKQVKELIMLAQFEQADTLYLDELTTALHPLRIYVFDINGKTIHLPKGATALDFAYALNEKDANRVSSVKVNDQVAPLFSELPSYSQVKLEYSKTSKVDRNWLKFVTTPRAKHAIKHRLKTLDKQSQYDFGAKLLFNVLQNTTNIDLSQHSWETFSKDPSIIEQCNTLLNSAKLPNIDTLITELSNGQRAQQVLEKQLELVSRNQLTFRDKPAQILNIDGLNFNLCPNCQPLPGEQVFGHFDNDKLIIHNKLCQLQHIDKKDSDKIVHLEWDQQSTGDYTAWIQIETKDKKGELLRILSALDVLDINVKELITQTDHGMARFLLAITITNFNQLQKCIDTVSQIEVHSIARYFPKN